MVLPQGMTSTDPALPADEADRQHAAAGLARDEVTIGSLLTR
ncbi:hypothetical protein [Nocardioides rubriscoriae]|nr:hypothetical protein [Nocardioides rubriscoriae]